MVEIPIYDDDCSCRCTILRWKIIKLHNYDHNIKLLKFTKAATIHVNSLTKLKKHKYFFKTNRENIFDHIIERTNESLSPCHCRDVIVYVSHSRW